MEWYRRSFSKKQRPGIHYDFRETITTPALPCLLKVPFRRALSAQENSNSSSTSSSNATKRVWDIKKSYSLGNRTAFKSSPPVVKLMFATRMPPSFFNDTCRCPMPIPRPASLRPAARERNTKLWEPKTVSRDQGRSSIRDIQDARFRKQRLLEKQVTEKERENTKRIENALMKESKTMTQGLREFLFKLERQKMEIDAKIHARRTLDGHMNSNSVVYEDNSQESKNNVKSFDRF